MRAKPPPGLADESSGSACGSGRPVSIRIASHVGVLAAGLLIGLVAGAAAGPPHPGSSAGTAALSEVLVGGLSEYAAQPGDSLTAVSARFGVAVGPLAERNGLSPRAWLRVGQRLRIDDRHVVPVHRRGEILVNIPQRYLFFIHEGIVTLAFPVGLGRPTWPTPTGAFEIGSRERNKTWVVPKSIQEEMRREGREPKEAVPPGPENPLGSYWLGLRGIACGIHGTTAPTSVYHFRSHGCIRARDEDAARLYEKVRAGEPVRIVYQPVLLAHLPDGSIWLEADPDVYRRGGTTLGELEALAQRHGLRDAVDWERAARVLEAREGLARRVDTSVAQLGGAR